MPGTPAIALTTIGGGINRLRVKGAADKNSLYDLVNGYVTQANTLKVRPGTLRTANLAAYNRSVPNAVAGVAGTWPPVGGWGYSSTLGGSFTLTDANGGGASGNTSAALNAVVAAYPAVLISVDIPLSSLGAGATAVTATLGGFPMQVSFATSVVSNGGGSNSYGEVVAHCLLPFTPGQFANADFTVSSNVGTIGGLGFRALMVVLSSVDPIANIGFGGGASASSNAYIGNGPPYFNGLISGPPLPAPNGGGSNLNFVLPPLAIAASVGDYVIESVGGNGLPSGNVYGVALGASGLGALGAQVTVSGHGSECDTLAMAPVTVAGSFLGTVTPPWSYVTGGSAAVLNVIKAYSIPVNPTPLTTPGVTRGLLWYQDAFHVFSASIVSVPPNFVLHVLTHPSASDSVIYPIKEIHFSAPYLGGIYVVAEFTVPAAIQSTVGSVFHYWIQASTASDTANVWTASTDYKIGDIVIPPVPNGLTYAATRLIAANPVWTPNTAETNGNIVEPTVPNGFMYTVTNTEGATPTTGATEPVWPTVDGSTVTENSTLQSDQIITVATPAPAIPPAPTPARYTGLFTKP